MAQFPAGYQFPILQTGQSLWICGYNRYGSLGNGTTVYYSSPIQIGALTNWKQVSGSAYHSGGIRTDGTLWMWGSNAYGELGVGTGIYVNYSSPIQIGSMTDWSQVCCGTYKTAAIKTDGTLWMMGQGGVGFPGYPLGAQSPTQIGTLTNWSTICLNTNTFLAIKTDGTLWACGLNSNGELGNGTTVLYSSPIQIGTLTNWKQVSMFGATPAAVKTDGTLWVWGVDYSGQLGNGTVNISYSSPIQIGALTNWSQVSSGSSHMAAVKTDGTLWAWGDNGCGQLGNGTTVLYSSPIQIGTLTNWKQVSAGNVITAAIKTDGTLWTCGYGGYGALGNGTTVWYSSPIQVGSLTNWNSVYEAVCTMALQNAQLPSSTVVDMADMFVRKELFLNAGLWSWGYNDWGQLGNANILSYSSPIQVGALTNWKQVSGGQRHTAAIKTDGTLWSFGFNHKGQLGNGTVNVYYSSPVQIGSLTNWKIVSAGRSHSSYIKTDGSLWLCGYNLYGQLGNGTTTDYSSPIQVGTLTNWKQVSAGANQIAALLTDGTLWTWGRNQFGQLGNGTTTSYSSPIQIGALTNWKQVSMGRVHFSIINNNGSLWICGNNGAGQLGNNDATLTNQSSPIQVGALTNWKQVSCGYDHTSAIKTDGTLWTWGQNNYGQLGNSTSVYYSSPIQIGALSNWKQVVACSFSTAAIKTDGTLWTWGYNASGQLGNGTVGIYYSSPIQVGALTTWKQISTGFDQAYFLSIQSPDLP